MDYRFIPGAGDFIRELKAHGYKLGLVTSSQEGKMRVALEQLDLQDAFDTVVTAGRVTLGKPDPECYLLAARDLAVAPGECVVFEDSIAGITAGQRAGMKVVALATTLPIEELVMRVTHILPDFSDTGAAFSSFQTG